MTDRIERVDLELSQHPRIANLQDAAKDDRLSVRGLLRWQGTPLGTVDAPKSEQCIPNAFPYYNGSLYRELIRNRLTQSYADRNPNHWRIDDALKNPARTPQSDLTVTIVYCFSGYTDPDRCDRTALLDSLVAQTHAVTQILVIEYDRPANDRPAIQSSAPSDPILQYYLSTYPRLQYLAVPQRDLESAQQMALEKCSGEVISFVDDRTVLDPDWAAATARVFDRNPEVRIMTGLILPLNQSAQHQVPYENLYGLACGFNRRWIHWSKSPNWMDLGIMQHGSPLNLAIHRSLLYPALNSPEPFSWTHLTDLLLQGEVLVYEPRSIVHHRLPATLAEVKQANYSGMRSFYRYILESQARHPHLRLGFFTLGLWKLTRVLGAWVKTYGLPRSWFTAELQGIRDSFQSQPKSGRSAPQPPILGEPNQRVLNPKISDQKMAQVFVLELSQPIAPIHAPDAKSVRLYVQWCDRLLGYITIEHRGKPVGVDRIADELIDHFLPQLLGIPFPDNPNLAWQSADTAIAQYFAPPAALPSPIDPPLGPLPNTVSVSIIVPTCDRPADLRQCLEQLQQVKTDRTVEIIVADNRPQSGQTIEVLKDFPQVKLIQEFRTGSSYARNAAIAASIGNLIVTVDDDVTVRAEWLEQLIEPFNRPEVLSVCGGVLPLVLETPAQMMFETVKGGLCFGFETREVNQAWLESFEQGIPPVWELGVSANAAFRSSIFSHPTIGLMEETLGAGTPAGGAEENHYAYKILRSGGTIVYNPSAYVWHHHRRTLQAFYKQIQGQMVSCPTLLLTLWLKEGDRRGRKQLLVHMPQYFFQCWRDRLLGRSKTPWIILFYEFKGFLMGFWGYWQCQQLVKHKGRSDRYIPVHERAIDD